MRSVMTYDISPVYPLVRTIDWSVVANIETHDLRKFRISLLRKLNNFNYDLNL